MSRAEWLNFFFTSFISLFAIVNPFGNSPLFLTLTEGRPEKEKKRVALRSAITSLLILSIERNSHLIPVPKGHDHIEAGDILLCFGLVEAVEKVLCAGDQKCLEQNG
jgi:hypothetical protein